MGTYKYDPTSQSSAGQAVPAEISFLTLNHLGTPTIISDSGENVSQKIKRDEWGTINSNNYDNNLVTNTSIGYTNQRQDIDSGLTYDHARYLSSDKKIWLSEDPMALVGFNNEKYLLDPQSQNSYSYAKNDPINKIDPDGRYAEVSFSGDAEPYSFSFTIRFDHNGFDYAVSGGVAVGYSGGVSFAYFPNVELDHERQVNTSANAQAAYYVGLKTSKGIYQLDPETKHTEYNHDESTGVMLGMGAGGSLDEEYTAPVPFLVWGKPNKKDKLQTQLETLRTVQGLLNSPQSNNKYSSVINNTNGFSVNSNGSPSTPMIVGQNKTYITSIISVNFLKKK